MSRFRSFVIRAGSASARIAAAGVVWLCVHQAAAQPAAETLGFDEAIGLAEVRSQALMASNAEVQAARERVVSAAQLPDPMLRFGINNLPIEGPDRFSLTRDFMTMQSVGVAQE